MILLIGGAYQGKLEYAKTNFRLSETDIYTCCDDRAMIDFSKRCINRLEEFTLACVRNQINSVNYIREHREEWDNHILICQDIFCGVVPLGAEMRAWRNETGHLCQYLSREAKQVSRIFCGLEQRLK
jgi:adenosyl cobinamide kinase/adenosyl cobinamide phosphate guanylyltransferase